MPITDQDVLDAFDSFGDKCVQAMALQANLRQQGFDITDIVSTINILIKQGLLVQNSTGSVSRT